MDRLHHMDGLIHNGIGVLLRFDFMTCISIAHQKQFHFKCLTPSLSNGIEYDNFIIFNPLHGFAINDNALCTVKSMNVCLTVEEVTRIQMHAKP